MVFRLMMSAKKKWRKISGPNRLPEVIQGVEFKDGIKQIQNAAWSGRHQLLGITRIEQMEAMLASLSSHAQLLLGMPSSKLRISQDDMRTSCTYLCSNNPRFWHALKPPRLTLPQTPFKTWSVVEGFWHAHDSRHPCDMQHLAKRALFRVSLTRSRYWRVPTSKTPLIYYTTYNSNYVIYVIDYDVFRVLI